MKNAFLVEYVFVCYLYLREPLQQHMHFLFGPGDANKLLGKQRLFAEFLARVDPMLQSEAHVLSVSTYSSGVSPVQPRRASLLFARAGTS